LCLVGTIAAAQQPQQGAQGAPPAQSAPPKETFAPLIRGVVAVGTPVVLIREGFMAVQGAAADPKDGSLLFTEREANKITKLDASGNFSTYLENTNLANSFAIDGKGRVIGVHFSKPPRVSVLAPTQSVLAEGFEGSPFGRANDLVVDRRGGVYFTDDLGAPPLPPTVYYINPEGKIIKVAEKIGRPNGVILSPDEKTLYIADTNGEAVIAVDIQPDGSGTNQRAFAKLEGVTKNEKGTNSGADGITIDGNGYIYVTSTAGIQVFDPKGQHMGTIPTPRPMQNIAFAGPNKRVLYVMGGNALYSIQMLVAGYTGRAK
jgi:gluconolactonase